MYQIFNSSDLLYFVFFLYVNSYSHYDPVVDSASDRNEYQES
jgi:hypothetical protein